MGSFRHQSPYKNVVWGSKIHEFMKRRRCAVTLQVSVVDAEAYEVPAGNQLKDGSRKSRRREKYTPRAEQRQAAAAAAVPA